jgi:hypothetical protein
MEFTLESLLDDLQNKAGMTKSASETTECEEKKDEETAKKDTEEAKKKLGEASKKDEEAEKKNNGGFPFTKKKEEDNAKDEQTKEAALKGADLAKEIMQKVASIQLDKVNTEDTMNKQAADAGKALAEALLTKLASVGDMNTMNGVAPGTVPNKTQVDLAAQVAEQDRIIQNQPGTDGRGNGGTINQIFDAIVADAIAQGAAPIDQNPAPGVTREEGSQVRVQSPNQVPTGAYTVANEEVEKAAAVSQLVSEGYDFYAAVDMVKAAETEIRKEEFAQIKQAALNHFMEAGFDFETSVALVKKLG